MEGLNVTQTILTYEIYKPSTDLGFSLCILNPTEALLREQVFGLSKRYRIVYIGYVGWSCGRG
jgi:hypothetical protein